MTIQELKDNNLLLLECVSGSKVYGLATASSDTDIKGVFYLPREQFFAMDYIAQVNDEHNNEVYYELGRFMELLYKNNPNILELLATPAEFVLWKHSLMEPLSVNMFLSQCCKDTFAGYAHTQIRKARGYNKKVVNPMPEERKDVLDFCFVIEGHTSIGLKKWLEQHNYKQERCGLTAIPHTSGLHALFYDPEGILNYSGVFSGPDANDVSLSSIPRGAKESGYLYFNADHYSAHCKNHREYWEWIGKRNEERYLNNKAHGKNYDSKNMMHTIRLLQVAEEIGREGKLNVTRSNREELLAIKKGAYSYEQLLSMADELMQRIEIAYESSNLPSAPDKRNIERLLVDMRIQLYK
jgi:predicted nucleotidyltransferase